MSKELINQYLQMGHEIDEAQYKDLNSNLQKTYIKYRIQASVHGALLSRWELDAMDSKQQESFLKTGPILSHDDFKSLDKKNRKLYIEAKINDLHLHNIEPWEFEYLTNDQWVKYINGIKRYSHLVKHRMDWDEDDRAQPSKLHPETYFFKYLPRELVTLYIDTNLIIHDKDLSSLSPIMLRSYNLNKLFKDADLGGGDNYETWDIIYDDIVDNPKNIDDYSPKVIVDFINMGIDYGVLDDPDVIKGFPKDAQKIFFNIAINYEQPDSIYNILNKSYKSKYLDNMIEQGIGFENDKFMDMDSIQQKVYLRKRAEEGKYVTDIQYSRMDDKTKKIYLTNYAGELNLDQLEDLNRLVKQA